MGNHEPDEPGLGSRRSAGGRANTAVPYVHHQRNCSHVSEGEGSGVGSAVVGAGDGVVESVSAGDESSLVGASAVVIDPDWGARVLLDASEGDGEPELSDADGDGEEEEGDGDASGEAESDAAASVEADSPDRGDSVSTASVVAAPSDVSPSADAVFGFEPGASVPSSARLSPPAARTNPATTISARFRRRRWAAALRSRRLPLAVPAPSASYSYSWTSSYSYSLASAAGVTADASRPRPRSAFRAAARPPRPASSTAPAEPSASGSGRGSASSGSVGRVAVDEPHPGQASAPLRCRWHWWQ